MKKAEKILLMKQSFSNEQVNYIKTTLTLFDMDSSHNLFLSYEVSFS